MSRNSRMILNLLALIPFYICRKPGGGLFYIHRCLFCYFLTALVFGCLYIDTTRGASNKPIEALLENNSSNAIWRKPENDGINCLYLQLRLMGYTDSYETFRKHASDIKNTQTMDSLEVLARRLGYHLVQRKLSFSELVNATDPIIVHMEDEGVGSGSFRLFLYNSSLRGTERKVALLAGATLRWISMTHDSFQRAWTSYALIPQPVLNWHTLSRRCGIVLLIGYIALLLSKQRIKQAG